MTLEEAQRLVQSFMRAHGDTEGSGLNAKGFGGAALGEAQIYFEHAKDSGALKCSALIYRFRDAPRPGVIDGFRAEEKAGTDTGGGKVDYETENKSLFLSRTYGVLPAEQQFKEDLDRLVEASLNWGEEVFNRVADRVVPAK
ncbi:hypothetical protein OV207_13875 [Corallococcus sp. BB11-1]|uniref:hypothetical protein n=1 Tax=Corallococcus sp. BB11-1 TaxID=2996783 RepID=UPI0022701D6C|nr:hypothetical protein [Corallococcus sp. BB11-1]MCY1032557.1 hypothetical protein [Corallococcus sp. BB11-1]